MTDEADAARVVRRRWLAIGIATVLMMFSYISVAASLVSLDETDTGSQGDMFVFGMALVPFVFMALAFVSGNRQAPGGVLRAMGWFVLLGLPLGVLAPPAGLAVGYAAGATTALRKEEYHSTRDRWIAVAATAVYVIVLLLVVPPGGLFAGAALPLVSIGIADTYTEQRLRREGTLA